MSGNSEERDNILKAALPSAFSQPVSLPSSPTDLPPSSSVPPPVPIPTTLASTTGASTSGEESSIDSSGWQKEYDSRVDEWRAQNAAQRKKAEETRERFVSIRAEEEAAAASSGRQPLPSFGTPGTEHVSVADGRDLVSGERQATVAASPPVSVSHPSETEHWEDVPSVASSFPSLPSHESPPSQPHDHSTQPPSSVPSKEAVNTTSPAKQSTSQQTASAPPASKSAVMAVTPKVLDKTLPVKTRAFALISSLAINMFLPFVNGLMMGFGEIFARNVIAPWIGWQSAPTAVGIRSAAKRPLDRLAAERDRLRSRKDDL